MSKRITTEDFINKSILIHGNIYDYTKTKYTKAIEKVIITCLKHGDFKVTPSHHIGSNQGCKVCSQEIRVSKITPTREYFISKATAVHGNTYDYSEVNYKNNKTKVLIICKEHGGFNQTPANHISCKSGCPECGKVKSKLAVTKTQGDFIKDALEVHGEKYDYSNTIYNGVFLKVEVLCKLHKKHFKVTASNHINGSGCPSCTLESRTMTTKKFLEKANSVHKGAYDYTETVYLGCYKRVWVKCKFHGFFSIQASNHLRGGGCKDCGFLLQGYTKTDFTNRCNKNNGGLGILYIIRCYDKSEVFYKVGITSMGIHPRFSGDSKMPYSYEIVKEVSLEPEFIYDLENNLLRNLTNYRYIPRLHFAGKTECFSTLEPILDCLRQYLNVK